MSRQQRRAQEREAAKQLRRETFDRVHGKVLEAKSVRHMWDVWRQNRAEVAAVDNLPPELKGFADKMLRDTFYAGVASMFELMQRVGPDDITEDQGVEMLTRLQEELDTYTKGLR